MRSLMRDITARFTGFIDGSLYDIMVILCEPEHSALLLKTLDALEQDPEIPDIFLTFGHPFGNPTAYVDQVLATVRNQLDQLNAELAQRGDQQMDPLPAELADEALLPEAKLLGIMQHVRGIVPSIQRVVWTIYPLEINDPAQYLRLIDYVSVQIREAPLAGTKLIVRDRVDPSILAPHLEKQPGVRLYQPELDPASMEKKLNEKANNPSVPPEEQAQIHMMLAGMDVANGRFDMALARNQELLGYFHHTGQKQQQSVLLNNIGDLHYIQKKYAEAQSWYEHAINLSVALGSQPLVLYQSMNLGHALFMQKRIDEAVFYYESAEKLAQSSNAPVQQIQALERIGIAKHQNGQPDEAAQAWEKAVDLSTKFHDDSGRRTNLGHLRQLYSETGDKKRLQECDEELSQLKAEAAEHRHE